MKILIGLMFCFICVLAFTSCFPVPCVNKSSTAVTSTTNSIPESPVIVLKMASWMPQQLPPPIDWDAFYYTFNAWADTIEQESGSRVKIERYPGESLIKMADMTDAVIQGLVDIVVIHPIAENHSRYPVSSLLSLPHLFPDTSVGSMVVQKLFEEGYYDTEFNKVHMLFRTINYPSDIGCRTKPIRTLEDFKDLKVGVMDEPEGATLRALGAIPVRSPVTKQCTALETGLIDATWLEFHGQVAFNLYHVAKYFTKAFGSARTLDVCMNLDTWNKLPPDIQQIINKNSGIAWSLRTGRRFDSNYEKSTILIEDYLKQNGYPPIEYPSREEIARWDKAWDSVYSTSIAEAESKGIPGSKIIDRARELVRMYVADGFSYPSAKPLTD